MYLQFGARCLMTFKICYILLNYTLFHTETKVQRFLFWNVFTLLSLGLSLVCLASMSTNVSRFFTSDVTANKRVTLQDSKASTNNSTFCVTLLGIITILTPLKIEKNEAILTVYRTSCIVSRTIF